jgi:hypothetical protein
MEHAGSMQQGIVASIMTPEMLEAVIIETLQGEKDSLQALQGVLDAGGNVDGAFTTKAVEQATRAMKQAMAMRARREAAVEQAMLWS